MSKVILEITHDGEHWVAEIKNLRVVGVGDTIKEALCVLGESIEVVIEGYAYEQDEHLTEGAKKLKEEILKLLGDKVIEDGE